MGNHSTNSCKHSLIHSLVVSTLVGTLLSASVAFAQAKPFDVPAQPARSGILDFAKQAGLQILAPESVLAGKQTNAVKGNLDAREALRQLLAGTDITIGSDNGAAITLTTPVAQAKPGVSAAESAVDEEIVITASRIARSGFTAPTPITVVGEADFQARAATTIANILFELPSARPAQTGITAAFSSGFNFANLRGLNGGASTRTLTLVDGRRFVPTDPQGRVDTNAVPAALVERLEVVTGGASAAWGSDAVSGVTNFIFKKKIDGLVGSIQYGQSQRHDNKEQGVNLAWGTSYANDRGQFMVAGEFSNLFDIARQGDREWGRQHTALNQPVAGSLRIDGVSYTRAAQSGLTLSFATFGGLIVGAGGAPLLTTNATTGVQTASSPLSGIQFGPGGTVLPFQYGANVGNSYMVGGSGVWVADEAFLGTPVKRESVYARTTYEITPSTTAFAEVSHAETRAAYDPFYDYNPNGDAVLTIARTNAYLPAAVRTIMTANNIASFNMGRIHTELGHLQYDTKTKVNRVAVGLDGTVGNGWKWNGYVTHGETNYHFEIRNFLNEANLRASIDAVVDASGNIVCNPATVTLLQADAGCVAANPFGQGSLTSAVLKYITGTESYTVLYKQDAGGASIQGEPFSTWAGPVSTAGGVEYRKESLTADSDAVSQKSTSSFPAGGWQFSNPKPYGGSYSVKEVFAETVIPLLADQPGFKTVDFNGAVRSTDYSTSGRINSSKIGLTYKPMTDLLLRGTKSVDNRAPNLNELYVVGQVNTGGVTDFKTGVAVTVPNSTTITNGYNKLTPEQGNTTTYGIAWTPSQVQGLSASVDVYKIQLKNAIGALGAQNSVNACFGVQGVPQNTSFCDFIQRDANGTIVRVVNPIINSAAGVTTNGYDVELSYRFPLANVMATLPGRLTLRALGTHVSSFKNSNGTTQTEVAGDLTATPKWRWNMSANYLNGPLTLFVQANYIESAKINNTFNVTNTTDIYNNDVPSRTYINTSAQYVLYDKGRANLTVFGNINNLQDKEPPINAGGGNAHPQVSGSQFYDLGGRTFKAGMRFTY